MNKNAKLTGIIIGFVLGFIVIASIWGLSYHSLKKNVNEEISKTMYASVVECGENYIKIIDENTNLLYYLKYNKNNIDTGDIIIITYVDKVDNFKNIEVIVHNGEDILDKITFPVNTTKVSTTKTTTKVVTTNKTSTSSKYNVSDNEIVSDIKSDFEIINKNNDKVINESIKEKFINVVDFIFYNKEINGRTFSSLSNEAKAKVIYYALLIDNKIDNKWPDYKNEISSKYKDVKSKLIAKYIDITDEVCNSNDNNDKLCKNLKNDFKLLKSSLNITWDIIKDAFKYGYNKSKDALIKWYEVFRGSL